MWATPPPPCASSCLRASWRATNVDQDIQKINHTMEQYLARRRLQELEDAMLLLERTAVQRQDPPGPAGHSWTWSSTSYEPGLRHPHPRHRGHRALAASRPAWRCAATPPSSCPTSWSSSTTPKKTIIEPLATDKAKQGDVRRLHDLPRWSAAAASPAHLLSKKQAEKVEDQLAALARSPALCRDRIGAEGKPVLLYRHGRRQPLPGHGQGLLGGAQAHPLPGGAADPCPPATPWWSW